MVTSAFRSRRAGVEGEDEEVEEREQSGATTVDHWVNEMTDGRKKEMDLGGR